MTPEVAVVAEPSFWSGFADFIVQNNIIGIAIGLLIATKVGELVKGFIDDLVTPLILNPILTKLKIKNIEELSYKGILYGKVLAVSIDFLITALIVYLFIRYAGVTMKK